MTYTIRENLSDQILKGVLYAAYQDTAKDIDKAAQVKYIWAWF
jgi:hypothetical protein